MTHSCEPGAQMGAAVAPPIPGQGWMLELRRADLILKIHQGLLAHL
jgi:hypothetical protein